MQFVAIRGNPLSVTGHVRPLLSTMNDSTSVSARSTRFACRGCITSLIGSHSESAEGGEDFGLQSSPFGETFLDLGRQSGDFLAQRLAIVLDGLAADVPARSENMVMLADRLQVNRDAEARDILIWLQVSALAAPHVVGV